MTAKEVLRKWTRKQQQRIDDAVLAGEQVTIYWSGGDTVVVDGETR